MDTLVQAVKNKQNVVISSMQGLERSRFLLRAELALLVGPGCCVSTVYHVMDKDRLIERVHLEATQMPFGGFDGVAVNKQLSGTNDDDNKESATTNTLQLTVCHLEYVFNQLATKQNTTTNEQCLFVFDGITLENLEGTCCEIQTRANATAHQSDANGESAHSFLPILPFARLAKQCRSIVLACNPPIDLLEVELGCKFPIVMTVNPVLPARPGYKVFASILARGPSGQPFKFGGLNYTVSNDHKATLHSDTANVMTSLAQQLGSGGIVVFFPSYGKMVEYHNAWQQLGVFEKTGFHCGRENRGDDHFKNSLIRFSREPKSIFLCSIRYHKEEDLAEFVLAQARAVVVVGIPYPFTNDTWDARIKQHDDQATSVHVLNGTQLHMYRGIEFMNGIVKRCLNEFRFRDCSLLLLDESLECNRHKLAVELGDVPVETLSECMTRLGNR
jgi:hypothetical protein